MSRAQGAHGYSLAKVLVVRQTSVSDSVAVPTLCRGSFEVFSGPCTLPRICYMVTDADWESFHSLNFDIQSNM